MSQPLHVAFVWHMHQPYYRDLRTKACSMPWVRLHAAKDYLDMVLRLEAFPSLHQTFNVVPSLLDQLEEYLPPTNASDRFLDLSRKPAAELNDAERRWVLEQFFMANWDRMVKPYSRYHDLLAKRGYQPTERTWPEVLRAFKTQDYLDVQVWFNLTWIDPWLRRQDPELRRLEAKGGQFTEADKHAVLGKQLEFIGRVIPAYRQAQQRGQIELSTSPYYHPILPLVCDLRAAHAALPQMAIPPEGFRHPEDARWHLREGRARHEAAFGQRPQGLWPSEGSVSDDVVRLVIEQGIRWIATDEEILWRTLRSGREADLLYRPHLLRHGEGSTAIIFRDRELSDLIGFVYSQWSPQAAAEDFIRRLGAIHHRTGERPRPPLVSIILDGENAWEYYQDDGHGFFTALYRALSQDDRFRLVTVSEHLEAFPIHDTPPLPGIFSGSWIDGNFATWIGHPEKNTAWSHLARVRQELVDLQQAGAAPPEALERAWRCFYAAEGSDWMWWLGDTHSSAQDDEFDRLFRAHLANVYDALEQTPPAWLEIPIISKAVQAIAPPSAPVSAVIDGRETSYYEWLYAGYADLRKGYGAAHRGAQIITALHYGGDDEGIALRLDLAVEALRGLPDWRIVIELRGQPAPIEVRPTSDGGVHAAVQGRPDTLACAFQRILELEIPHTVLGIQPGDPVDLRLSLWQASDALERYPAQGTLRLEVTTEDVARSMWSV
jgi:alpha-amylase/alpha-mannosidase (GH57 family)